ncbi:hypothetical protein [Cryptosporangium sp. NPDC051539]|uniref:hypothetical protein n=1 Tax=Cryptosporangium sp. NPDC051539 TaxID=3363962 RepID=UPI0037B4FDD6
MNPNLARAGALSLAAAALSLAALSSGGHGSSAVASETDGLTHFPPGPPVIIGTEGNPILPLPSTPATTREATP